MSCIFSSKADSGIRWGEMDSMITDDLNGATLVSKWLCSSFQIPAYRVLSVPPGSVEVT